MHTGNTSKIGAFHASLALFLCGLFTLSGCASWRPVEHPSLLMCPPLRFTPPEAERVVLDCGAVVYLLPDHRLPLFSLYSLARAGSAYDPKGKEGMASLTATVMRTGGTRNISPDNLDRELEFMAANIFTSTDRDASSVSLSCLSDDIAKALHIYLEIILHPEFARDRIDLSKGQVREAIRRWNDEPSQIVSREFRRLIYGPYPYGHPVIGEPGSMGRISRDDLIAFHKERFRPSGIILAAAGDFERGKILRSLNEAFGPEKTLPLPALPPVKEREKRSLNYIERDTEQAHLMIGHLGIRRDNPDYFPIMIMNEILGAGGFTSRILERLRSSEGLTYHAGTDFTTNIQTGLFYATCQTKEKTTTEALSLIMNELEQIRSAVVSEKELARAKEAFTNSFVFRFTDPSQIVQQMAAIEFYGLPRDYLERYLERVAAVNREDVLRVALTYLHPGRVTILVLGDRKNFSEPLDKFGEVNVIKIETAEDTEDVKKKGRT